MSLKNYIFSSINTKGAQDSDKFATIRLRSLRANKMDTDKKGAAEFSDVPVTNVTYETTTNAAVPGKMIQIFFGNFRNECIIKFCITIKKFSFATTITSRRCSRRIKLF